MGSPGLILVCYRIASGLSWWRLSDTESVYSAFEIILTKESSLIRSQRGAISRCTRRWILNVSHGEGNDLLDDLLTVTCEVWAFLIVRQERNSSLENGRINIQYSVVARLLQNKGIACSHNRPHQLNHPTPNQRPFPKQKQAKSIKSPQ